MAKSIARQGLRKSELRNKYIKPEDYYNDFDIKKFAESDPIANRYVDAFKIYASNIIQNKCTAHFFDGFTPTQRRTIVSLRDLKGYQGQHNIKSTSLTSHITEFYLPAGDPYSVCVGMMNQSFNNLHYLFPTSSGWGNLTNDTPSASRYTTLQMSKLAQEVFVEDMPKEIEKTTGPHNHITPKNVTWQDEYWEEEYLPSRLPTLLIQGSKGLGLGLSQSWVPFNFTSVIKLFLEYINTGKVNYSLLKLGFPTECNIITSRAELEETLKKGQGSVKYCASYQGIPDKTNKKLLGIKVTHTAPNLTLNKIGNTFNEWVKEHDTIFDEFENHTTEDKVEIRFMFKKPVLIMSEDDKNLIRQETVKLFKAVGLYGFETVIMNALKNSRPKLYSLEEYLKDWVEERLNIISRKAVVEVNNTNKKLAQLELLKKVQQNSKVIVQLLQDSDAETPEDWLKVFSTKIADVDEKFVQYVLSLTLRQITKSSAKDCDKQIKELTEYKLAQQNIAKSEDQRKQILIQDFQWFIDNKKKLGINDYCCEFDEDNNNKLSAQFAQRAEKQEQKSLEELLSGEHTNVVISTKQGYVAKYELKSLRDKVELKSLFSTDAIMTVLSTGRYCLVIEHMSKIYKVLDLEKLDNGKLYSPAQIAKMVGFSKARTPKGFAVGSFVDQNPEYIVVTNDKNQIKHAPYSELEGTTRINCAGNITGVMFVNKDNDCLKVSEEKSIRLGSNSKAEYEEPLTNMEILVTDKVIEFFK